MLFTEVGPVQRAGKLLALLLTILKEEGLLIGVKEEYGVCTVTLSSLPKWELPVSFKSSVNLVIEPKETM